MSSLPKHENFLNLTSLLLSSSPQKWPLLVRNRGGLLPIVHLGGWSQHSHILGLCIIIREVILYLLVAPVRVRWVSKQNVVLQHEDQVKHDRE